MEGRAARPCPRGERRSGFGSFGGELHQVLSTLSPICSRLVVKVQDLDIAPAVLLADSVREVWMMIERDRPRRACRRRRRRLRALPPRGSLRSTNSNAPGSMSGHAVARWAFSRSARPAPRSASRAVGSRLPRLAGIVDRGGRQRRAARPGDDTTSGRKTSAATTLNNVCKLTGRRVSEASISDTVGPRTREGQQRHADMARSICFLASPCARSTSAPACANVWRQLSAATGADPQRQC